MESTADKKISCYACNKELDLNPGQKIIRSEECAYCYASLHCCKMCGFYDATAYNECKESSADRIVEKEKANFCDFFILKGGSGSGPEKDDLLSAADALFKN
jgi:NAD-dependent SIR2 family protein deacetylase